jgi:WD40 repeat protein
LAFSKDGTLLAATTVEDSIRVLPASFDEAQPPVATLVPGNSDEITRLEFLDGQILSTSRDGTLRETSLNAPAARPYVSVSHQLVSGLGALPVFSPDGKAVALVVHNPFWASANPTNSATTLLWDLRSARELARIPSQFVAWHSRDRALTCNYRGRLDLWDLSDLENPRMASPFQVNTNHHSFHESQLADGGRWVVSLDAKTNFHAFNVGSGRVLRLTNTAFESIASSPTAPVVALSAANGTVLLNLEENRLTPLTDTGLAAARFSPSGNWLIVSDWQRGLVLFDGRTGRRNGLPLAGVGGDVTALAFTPDDRQVVTGGDDYSLVIWNLATRREVFRMRMDAPINWIEVSPDGQWLVTGHPPKKITWGSPGEYRLWPITGLPIRPAVPPPAAPDSVWRRHELLARDFPAL